MKIRDRAVKLTPLLTEMGFTAKTLVDLREMLQPIRSKPLAKKYLKSARKKLAA